MIGLLRIRATVAMQSTRLFSARPPRCKVPRGTLVDCAVATKMLFGFDHMDTVWLQPAARPLDRAICEGMGIDITVGVEPEHASNRVQVYFKINDGPVPTVTADPPPNTGAIHHF